MNFQILGSVDVFEDGRRLPLGGPKQRLVLAQLLIRANSVVATDTLIEEIWGEETPDAARSSLQAYVSRLRKSLGPGRLEGRPPGYVLHAEPEEVDAARFEQLVRRARDRMGRDPEAAADLLDKAFSLWKGPALAGLTDEPSLRLEVARLEELHLVASEDRIEAAFALGRQPDIAELKRLVDRHPLRERFWGQLMLALYQSGRQAEALDVYSRARNLLAEELGIDPSPELRRLHEQVLRQDPVLELRGSPLRGYRLLEKEGEGAFGVVQPRLNFTNLPAQPTHLIGRNRELAEARVLLREHRLLTLTGPGGSGKTRLALQLAAEAAEQFQDGVFWVPLAPIRDPELVRPTISQAVGARDGLAEHLRERNALLLLDNFEQVGGAASDLAELLDTAPNLKLLVTSREPLHLSAEWEYAVPPLAANEAVALFTERARARKADFEPDSEVAEICRRLDGLPLAIELAAVRVRVLTPRQILERLGRRLDLLTAVAQRLPDRHRSLRASMEWSYELLDQDEQRLLARLAVFIGGWTLDAAEAVCEAALDTLQSLVAKNLVRHEAERFTMLETIREYALERLQESGEAADLVDRHGRFFLALAEEATPDHEDLQDTSWIQRLDDEHDNLRAALVSFIRSEAADLQLRLVAAVWSFWSDRGYGEETLRFLERALEAKSGDRRARVRALQGAAWIAWRNQGDIPRANRFADESIGLSRELGDEWLLARSLRIRGVAERDWDRATPLLEESARLSRSLGDMGSFAAVTNNLAHRPLASGDYRHAADLFEEALSMARQVGDERGSVIYLLNLGQAECGLGDYQAAAADLAESLQMARDLALRELVVEALYAFAALWAALGDHTRAATIIGVAQGQADFGNELRGFERQQLERTLQAVRANIDDYAFERAVRTGRTFKPDAAMEYTMQAAARVSTGTNSPAD